MKVSVKARLLAWGSVFVFLVCSLAGWESIQWFFFWTAFFWFLQVPSEQRQEAIMDRLSAIERKIDRHEQ